MVQKATVIGQFLLVLVVAAVALFKLYMLAH